MLDDYPSFNYNPPGEPFGIDIVSRLGEAFAYDDLEATTRMMNNVPVRVVTPAALYRMKRDTVRPQDRIDAANLRDMFDIEEP
jgi:hypothetical protein